MTENKSHPEFWVACSGGIDSVVLVHLMHSIKKSIGILHCNFQLRKEAAEDKEFVISLAKKLSIPIRTKEFLIDQEKENTQLAARNLRYEWFEKVKTETGAPILLAHHLDDQIETFFLQLERGGGIYGLAGMPKEHKRYIRPLLNYSKQSLITLAKQNKWEWREDLSNQKTDYQRNYYRLTVLPFLEKQGLKKNEIIELVNDFQQFLNWIEKNKFDVKENADYSISIKKWEETPVILRKELLHDFKIPRLQEKEVDKLTNSIKGTSLTFKNSNIWNEGKELFFERRESPEEEKKLKVSLITKDEIDFSSGDIYVDKSKVTGNLSLRKWEKGDRFKPLGIKGSKLVSDFLTDKKVPAHLRSKTLVIKDAEKIIAIVGFQPSEKVKIDDETAAVLKIEVEL